MADTAKLADSAKPADAVEATPPPEVETTPTKSTRQKAAEAAAAALEAQRRASQSEDKTRKSIVDTSSRSMVPPCQPLSVAGFDVEDKRGLGPDSCAHGSPYCRHTAGMAVLSYFPAQDELDALLGNGLQHINLHGARLSTDDTYRFAGVLNKPGCTIKSLNLRRSLDAFLPQDPSDALKARILAEVRAEIGEETPEVVEQLTATLEKLKEEYTTFDAALELLAKQRVNAGQEIMNALASNGSVEDLNLSNNNFGAPKDGRASYQPLRRIGKLLDLNTTVTTLDLSDNHFGPQGCGIVAKSMCKNIRVLSLDVSGNELMEEPPEEDEDGEAEEEDAVFGELAQGLEAFSEVLKKNKFLRTLCLRQNRIKGEATEEDDGADTPFGKLMEPLKKYHRLETLDLAVNELGPGGARILLNTLKLNHSVKVLDISDNEIGAAGLHHIAALVSATSTLTTLTMRKNNFIGKKGSKRAAREALAAVQAFAKALLTNTSLTSLNIGANLLGPQLCSEITAVLSKTNLEELYIDSNDMCGNAGADTVDTTAVEPLAEALSAADSKLRVLNIGYNFTADAGIQALLVKGCPALEVLNACRNGIGADGITAVHGAPLPKLRNVNLSHNLINSAAAVVGLLRNATGLRDVDLSANELGTDSADAAMLLNEAIGGVESLLLNRNKLTTNNTKGLIALATQPAKLSHLSFVDNPSMTSEDAVAILDATATGSAALCSLSLSTTAGKWDTVTAAALNAAQKNASLKDLDVRLPQSTNLDVMPLRRALLKNALA